MEAAPRTPGAPSRMEKAAAVVALTLRGRLVCSSARRARSAHVDVGDLDGVVAVAQAVPGRNVGLHVARRVGRAGAERVPTRLRRVPGERPALPCVRLAPDL